MKVSLNQIRQFLDFELPHVDELVARINSQLGGVEEVIDLGAKYKDAVIVKIVKCDKHPNADRLSVCAIDDGGSTPDVNRGEDGLIQVVCGAPNVHPDMFAVWLPPKSTVPASYDDKEPFVLEAREIRGVMSNGMLAAGDELAINNDHDGIVEITDHDLLNSKIHNLKSGQKFAEVFGLNDTVIDIENKMFTHRPDCFGQLGVAREIAGILGHAFKSPDWYSKIPEFTSVKGVKGETFKLDVFNEAKDKVPRFMAVAIRDIEVKASPLWLQCALVAMGSKPINNIVDVTNYVMLITAQPTHAYDYDKLRGEKLGVRLAKKDENVTLLNGKTYELDENDIVIADGEGVIGLGGIMGGLDSEVTKETKNIVLECANFDMYTLRKSSMRHGIFTDALTRFNKGQSPLQNPHILNILMMGVKDVSPTTQQASDVFDEGQNLDREERVEVTPGFINSRLGLELEADDINSLLTSVEFEVESSEALHVTSPFWRTDIEIPEDVVEEVGRLYGFDKLPRELPKRSIKPAAKNELFELKSYIRQSLAKAGANEVLTYSFAHENLLKKAGQNPKNAFKLSNALSPDLQYYRLSLTPSLLDKIHMNIKAGHDEFALFEIGKTHILNEPDPIEPDAPKEVNTLSLVYTAKSAKNGAAYYMARKYLMNLSLIGEWVHLEPLAGADLYKNPWLIQMTAPFEPNRSAVLRDNRGLVWGVVGEFKASVHKSLKLPDYTAGFEIDPMLLIHTEKQSRYIPLPRFPKVTQDITLQVPAEINYQELYDFVWGELAKVQPADTLPSLSPISIFQKDEDKQHKNITFRLEIASYDRTLTDQEVSQLLDKVAQAAKSSLKAERI